MKLFLPVLLSFFVSFAISQTENLIVDNANIWSTVDIHCLPNGTSYSTYFIKFESDTVIEGFNYQKVKRCNEEDQLTWDDYGFIREDAEHRVFLRPPDYYEGLIYDFGVETGDTLEARNIYLNNDTLHFVVVNVDSVLLLDGYKKRVILYEYLNEKEEVWIEGLGSYFGILNSCNNSYGSACGVYEALCYENNGVMIYENPAYTTCYYTVLVGSGLTFDESIKIYPNPANGFVTVEVPYGNIGEIEIFDLNGKKILNKMFSGKKVSLNLQQMDKGMYTVKLNDFIFSYPPYKLIVD